MSKEVNRTETNLPRLNPPQKFSSLVPTVKREKLARENTYILSSSLTEHLRKIPLPKGWSRERSLR